MERQNYSIWLETILIAKDMTQTQLARDLGVTHATLNRWLSEKTTPHPKTLDLIHAHYQQIVFYSHLEKGCDVFAWQKKFSALKKGAVPPAELIANQNLKQDYTIKFTYHTNAIEGSTLSLPETQGILIDHQVIPSHPLREHLEVMNHKMAFDRMLTAVIEKQSLTLNLILDLHRILMNGILEQAGVLRAQSVRIAGTRVIPPQAFKVHEKMTALVEQMEACTDPIGMIMHHAWFEAIHPFADGNGRIGRLLLNYQLLRHEYPLAIIHVAKKHLYYHALEQAQLTEIFTPLIDFIYQEMSDT